MGDIPTSESRDISLVLNERPISNSLSPESCETETQQNPTEVQPSAKVEFEYDYQLTVTDGVLPVDCGTSDANENKEANEHDENLFAKISITSERFLIISNKVSDILLSFTIIVLFLFFIADSQNYNFFPFEVEPVNGVLYQIAQITFMISYGTSEILILRCLIIVGTVFFIAEFTRNAINIDFLLYNIIAILVNARKIVELLYKRRPIKFDPYREQVYEELFEDFMERDEFKLLTKHSLLRDIQRGAFYAHAHDRCQALTILLSGQMQILKPTTGEEPSITGRYSDESKYSEIYINENEFIDSSQWVLREITQISGTQEQRNKQRLGTHKSLEKRKKKKLKEDKGKRFNYEIKAVSDCKYMFWPRELLMEQLKKHPELKSKLTAVLGLDVSHKVFQMNSFY